MFTRNKIKPKNYLEAYNLIITPKLKEIDILIKSMEETLYPFEVAYALDLSDKEVNEIMCRKGIVQIDKDAFFEIMLSGSSDVCGLYQREVECGSPLIYTIEQISYIYNIEINQLKRVCSELCITEATAIMLPEIFIYITI